MRHPNKNSLMTWLLSAPLTFGVLSMILMIVAAFLYALISGWITGGVNPGGMLISIGVGFAFAVVAQIRMLEHEKLNRRQFISINTAQTFIICTAFLAASLFVVLNANAIMAHIWRIQVYHDTTAMFWGVIVSVFYMYLAGMFVASVYAKYLRARAMNVAPWKIIFSIPFGLSMLWCAGYTIDDDVRRNATDTQIRPKWYATIVNRIAATPLNTAITLGVMIAANGFVFGPRPMLITLAMGLVFAGWLRAVGPEQLRKNIGGAFSTIAVILNIITIVSIIAIGATSTANKVATPNEQIVISDTIATQNNN